MSVDFKRILRTVAIAAAFTTLLQSCAALADRTITVKPGTTGAKTARLSPDDEFDYTKAISKLNESAFVTIARSDSKESINITLYGTKLDTLWMKSYKCDEDESTPTIWCSGNDINILTVLSLDDSLRVIARKIDSKDGKLIKKVNLIKEDLDKLNGTEFAQLTISSDSSKLLVVTAPEMKEEGDKKYATSKHTLFDNDFSQVYSKNLIMELPENDANEVNFSLGFGGLQMRSTALSTTSPLAVNSRGDIYYSSYKLEKNAVWETMNRLGATENTPKKIKATSASVANTENHGWPVNPQVKIVNDDVVTSTWHYANGELTRGVSVGKYDFGQNVALFNTMNAFTMEESKKLVNEEELENYRLVESISLPNGETFSLLEYYSISASYSPGMMMGGGMMGGGMRTAGSTSTTYTTGPFIALKTGAHGEKVWINSFRKHEESLDNFSIENESSRWMTDNSIIYAYRSRTQEGVSLCEFMLADGSVRTATLPLIYTQYAIFYPAMALWNNDRTAIFFGHEGSDGIKIVNIPLPETKPYLRPVVND